MRMIWWCE